MRWARTNHRALLLRDGRVFVVGGTVVNEESREHGTPPPSYAAEVWDPGSGNWSTVQGVVFPSGQSVIPALLSDCHVQLGVVDHSLDAVYEFSLWDPQDGSVTDITKVPRARPGGQLLTFPDGHLLYAGGTDQTQTRNTPRCTEDTGAEESDGDEKGPELTEVGCVYGGCAIRARRATAGPLGPGHAFMERTACGSRAAERCVVVRVGGWWNVGATAPARLEHQCPVRATENDDHSPVAATVGLAYVAVSVRGDRGGIPLSPQRFRKERRYCGPVINKPGCGARNQPNG